MKKFLAIMLAALMCVCLAACTANTDVNDVADNADANVEVDANVDENADAADNEEKVESDLEYVKNKGTLVVGITDFAPMDYKNENGEWIGFDADMAKAFAESLGVEVEFAEIVWDNKILELDSKTIDCVWNGMTLTEDVMAAMDCSEPYCNNQQVVIVAADKAENYKTAEDCKELQFAVESGSAGNEMADQYGFEYTAVTDQATALMEVASGTSDAAIIDSLMAAAMVGEGTAYESLAYTVGLNDEKYGVGFRKGSDLTQMLNDFFAACAADGSLDAVAATYSVQAALIK